MFVLSLLLAGSSCAAWPNDPATVAYAALRERRLDDAVSAFRQALPCNPVNARLRKDFAYTLLRTGDRLAARTQFEDALRLDASDETTALECAFLNFETGRRRQARQAFQRLLSSSNPDTRAMAAKTFEDIDEPLRQGIARWREALQRAPGQWSGHEELARLAEQRDELDLAATEFQEAWRRRPAKTDLLLDIARVWQEQGETAKARSALVTAWRAGSPRVAESAREALEGVVPDANEFALAIPHAEQENSAEPVLNAREMGARSLENSYLADALKYLSLAHQQNPDDAQVLYQLGVTNNMLHHDAEALQWFAKARRAQDPEIARKSAQAYTALRATQPGFHLSAWMAPIHSSIWNDLFVYAQVRVEYRGARSIVTPYVSLRFLGDARTGLKYHMYDYLSETSVIPAVGLKVQLHPRAYGWFEAGEAVSYLGRRRDTGLAMPDYRGGIGWSKGWGRLFGSPEDGWFAESAVDGVYIHRQQDDMLLYSQSQTGYTLGRDASGHQWSVYCNYNLIADSRGDQWANKFEIGPGIRLSLKGMPRGMLIRYDVLYGRYTMPYTPLNAGSWDVRTGIWYAFSR